MILNALNVSEYILKGLSEPDAGDIISNLKLQKLLYYAQGIHLVRCNKALFKDKIYHWQHGPVVKSVYEKYKSFNSRALEIPEEVGNLNQFSEKDKYSIALTYNYYGKYSAWLLREKTHQEDPWKNTKLHKIITQKAIKTFFKKELPSLGIVF